MSIKKIWKWLKWLLLSVLVLFLIFVGVVIYLLTRKFPDTAGLKADYEVEAMSFLKDFIRNDSLANLQYEEKIVLVHGRVSEKENADTTVNIKFIDSLTHAYIIFDFQQQHLDEARNMQVGDSVSIQGSCSGGVYSNILSAEFVSFKRCALLKVYH